MTVGVVGQNVAEMRLILLLYLFAKPQRTNVFEYNKERKKVQRKVFTWKLMRPSCPEGTWLTSESLTSETVYAGFLRCIQCF